MVSVCFTGHAQSLHEGKSFSFKPGMQTLATFSGELSRGSNLFAGNTFNRNTYERGINNQAQGFNTHPPKHMQRL